MFSSLLLSKQQINVRPKEEKMVSLRFISSFLVLLTMLYVRDCSANKYYNQASNIAPVTSGSYTKVVEAERTAINSYKEIYDGVPTAAEVKNKRRGARKMMVKEVGVDGEEAQISGAEHFVGSCNNRGKGILNVEHDKTTRPRRLKAKMADFIAFNADYHVPRPHPPKNN